AEDLLRVLDGPNRRSGSQGWGATISEDKRSVTCEGTGETQSPCTFQSTCYSVEWMMSWCARLGEPCVDGGFSPATCWSADSRSVGAGLLDGRGPSGKYSQSFEFVLVKRRMHRCVAGI